MPTEITILSRAEVDRYGYDTAELDEYPVKRMCLEHAFVDFEEGPESLWVLSFITDLDYRHQGYGTRLLEQLVAYAKGKVINWGAFTPEGELYLKPVILRMARTKGLSIIEFN